MVKYFLTYKGISGDKDTQGATYLFEILDEEKIAEKTKNAVTNGVEKGVKKAKDKLKDIKIELPDLEVLASKGGFKFINNLREQFSSIEDLLARNDRLSESIKLSLGGIPIALSESEIAIQEAIS